VNAHVGRGHDRSGPLTATKQGELAEEVTWAQVGDLVVVAVYGGLAALD
jgi:hypothetical protein